MGPEKDEIPKTSRQQSRIEPFPEKWTRKCKKKQNESLIFCEVLVHAA